MIHYLSRSEVATRIGLARGDSLSKYTLPPHDAIIGGRRGWLPATIDSWQENRPGRGNWGPKKDDAPSPVA